MPCNYYNGEWIQFKHGKAQKQDSKSINGKIVMEF